MEKEKAREMVEYRRKLIRDADSFKKTDRVPFYTNSSLWHYHDAGYSANEVCRSYELNKICQVGHIRKYDPDMIITGNRNPFPVKDSLGKSSAYIETESGLNSINEEFLDADDYKQIAAGNYDKVMWEHGVFHKFQNAANMTAREFAQASRVLKEWDEGMAYVSSAVYGEGVLELTDARHFCCIFFETLFNCSRGIKALSIDLRRRPKEVEEACDYMNKVQFDPIFEDLDTLPYGGDLTKCFDTFSNLLGHTILNQKQFDIFMARPYGKLLEKVEEKGMSWFNFSEATWMRFADFFGQYKKGTVSMMVEMDDIFEMRKKHPNIALWGGLSVDTLGHGTPEECVDQAKRAIEELSGDGGLVLMPNKMLSYPYDCLSENLKAVSDYVHTYSK